MATELPLQGIERRLVGRLEKQENNIAVGHLAEFEFFFPICHHRYIHDIGVNHPTGDHPTHDQTFHLHVE